MKIDVFEPQLAHNARQIWLAGLGAFARTQEEGGKFFDGLVQEGQAVDSRMKKAADEKTGMVKGRVGAVKDQVGEIRDQATGAWNKLEEVFQTRVARALRRLGIPTKEDIQQLLAQVDDLTRNIQALTQARAENQTCKTRPVKIAEPVA